MADAGDETASTPEQTTEPAVSPTATVVSPPASDTPVPSPTFTPTPSPTPTMTPQADCTDLARFVSETVPDGTAFNPGQKFEKKWVLRNAGTCSWTTAYELVFVDGTELGEPGPLPLATEVKPESTGNFVITFTAPDKAGEYRSSWKLRNDRGEEFGLGTDGSKPFWAEILVVDTGNALDLGTPDWIDTFSGKSSAVFTGEDSLVKYSIQDGFLVMQAKQTVGDQWRMVNRPAMTDFYLEAVFKMGDKCSGLDNYGFIIRASKGSDDFIDSGYVFGFSCDGRYRLYRMDGGVYTGIRSWGASPNLTWGTDQENKIGVLAVGDSLTIYINGAKVAELTDSTYAKGTFGLMIGAQNTANLEVLVDQIATWNVP
jgi:hypothetical protein